MPQVLDVGRLQVTGGAAGDQRRADEVGEVRAADQPGRVVGRVLHAVEDALGGEGGRPGRLGGARRCRADAAAGLVGVVRIQRVGKVIPGDLRVQRVYPRIDRGGGELHLAAVAAAPHAHPRVVGLRVAGVVGRVMLDDVQGRRRGGVLRVGERDARCAAEIADQLAGGDAVVVGVVQGDLAAGTAESQAGVGEHDVALTGLLLGERHLVGVGAAEAVGGQDGRHRGGRGSGGRHEQQPDHITDLASGSGRR